ncbi:MAG: TonB family protein [Mariprofundus sp.]|nr:TonB family protein [Mariprofundus sp.]
MIWQGYARLMAAMVAAVTLHALLFFLLPPGQQVLLQPAAGALQVELLANHKAPPVRVTPHSPTASADKAPEPARRVAPPPKQAVAEKKYEPPVITVATATRSATSPSGTTTMQEHRKPERPAAVEQPEKPLTPPTPHALSKDASGSTTTAAIVPRTVQKRILAEVHYPMQARRHGWQGRAEFELSVDKQLIHTVTMLASTGHPILDRAAQRGLASVRHIPLSNGLYRMPVVFHLQ